MPRADPQIAAGESGLAGRVEESPETATRMGESAGELRKQSLASPQEAGVINVQLAIRSCKTLIVPEYLSRSRAAAKPQLIPHVEFAHVRRPRT
jgi:hypothetical protein